VSGQVSEIRNRQRDLKERLIRIHRNHDNESRKLAALVAWIVTSDDEAEDQPVQEFASHPEADKQGFSSFQKELTQFLQPETVQRIEKSGRNDFEGHTVDLEQLSARRGPPTDRPPGQPPPCKGAIVESLTERAGSPYLSQLASSSCGSYSLSGNATPLQQMQFEVCAPSNYSATSSQVGSSPSQVPEDDECLAGCTRVATGSGSTGYACDLSHPSPNLSHSLFLCGRFLLPPNQRRPMAQRDNSHFGSWLHSPGQVALRAVVGCSQAPRWGQTK
jgi:hypothetical protein